MGQTMERRGRCLNKWALQWPGRLSGTMFLPGVMPQAAEAPKAACKPASCRVVGAAAAQALGTPLGSLPALAFFAAFHPQRTSPPDPSRPAGIDLVLPVRRGAGAPAGYLRRPLSRDDNMRASQRS